MTSLLSSILIALLSSTSFAQSSLVQLNPTSPHEVTSAICGTCHQDIYAEWQKSMHSQSTALSDPIHEAFYRKVMGDPLQEGLTNKKGKYPVCLQCHAPNAALTKKTKLDAVASYDEGVSCIFCHTISGYKGIRKDDGKLRLGVAAYEVSTTALQSPSGRNYTTSPTAPPSNDGSSTGGMGGSGFHPFPMVSGNQAVIKSDELCLGCHDQRNNASGVPLCFTGDEIVKSNTGVSCQSCHMSTVNGHSSHTMMGGHDGNTIRRGVTMALALSALDSTAGTAAGVKASLNLNNRLPHRFPTGAPFRNIVIKVVAYDANGKSIWTNPSVDPFKVESKSVLAYRLGDADGAPSGPPTAKKALSDTRLEPHEKRLIEYQIPVEGVKTVRADMYYSLLWPHLLKKLDKKLTDDLKTPKHVATAEASL